MHILPSACFRQAPVTQIVPKPRLFSIARRSFSSIFSRLEYSGSSNRLKQVELLGSRCCESVKRYSHPRGDLLHRRLSRSAVS